MCGRAQIASLVSVFATANNDNVVGRRTEVGMCRVATDADERPDGKADGNGQRNVVNWQTYSLYKLSKGFRNT